MNFFHLFCLLFLLSVVSATTPNGHSSDCAKHCDCGKLKFFPGNVTMNWVLIHVRAQKPLTVEFLSLDLADMYSKEENIDYVYENFEALVKQKLDDFDAAQVVCAVFQFDLLLDHILAKPICKQTETIKKVLNLRKTLLEDVKVRYPHYRIALEIISECPSYQIAQLKDSTAYPLLSETFSISTFLNKVTSLQGILNNDPHIAVHAYFSAISLLSSRLQYASDVDALFWTRAFLDNTFWFSDMRAGYCLAAIYRSKHFQLLEGARFNFSLASWKKVALFLPERFKHTVEVLRPLITESKIPEISLFADRVQNRMREKAMITYMVGVNNLGKKTDEFNLNSMEAFRERPTLPFIFKDYNSLEQFIVTVAVTLGHRELLETSLLALRFPKFFSAAALPFPDYSVDESLLKEKTFTPTYPYVKHLKLKSLKTHLIPAIYSIALMGARNYRSLSLLYYNVRKPEALLCSNLIARTKTSKGKALYYCMADLLVDLMIKNMNIEHSLDNMQLMPILGNIELMSGMETFHCVLVEATISYYLVQQAKIPKRLLEISGPFSFNTVVGKMRGISTIIPKEVLLCHLPDLTNETCPVIHKVSNMTFLLSLLMTLDRNYPYLVMSRNFPDLFYNVLHSSRLFKNIIAMFHEFNPSLATQEEVSKDVMSYWPQNVLIVYSWGSYMTQTQKLRWRDIYVKRYAMDMSKASNSSSKKPLKANINKPYPSNLAINFFFFLISTVFIQSPETRTLILIFQITCPIRRPLTLISFPRQ